MRPDFLLHVLGLQFNVLALVGHELGCDTYESGLAAPQSCVSCFSGRRGSTSRATLRTGRRQSALCASRIWRRAARSQAQTSAT